jgi:hypothetical protein
MRNRHTMADMVENNDAQTYLSGMSKKMKPLAEALHASLISLGCVSYVKTIYIGYDIDGEMVAALYRHSNHVEIALALPEDAEGELLVDARHLTWRTLPVAAVVRSLSEVPDFEILAKAATERIKTATHNVSRDNDFFSKTRRERQGPGFSIKRQNTE